MDDTVATLARTLAGMRAVDLSPRLERGIPRWPTHPHLVIDPTVVHAHDGYFCQTIAMAEHTGSHVDAPAHICADRMEATIDTFAVDHLVAPAVVYDFADRNLGPAQTVDAEDLLALEAKQRVAAGPGDIALVNFGWLQRHWRVDREAWYYARNQPGLSEAAVELLADRRVRAVGLDTIAGESPMLEGVFTHQAGHDRCWLPQGILILECLANLHQLPPSCFFAALPLSIQGGSGSPVRAVAFVPR